MDFDEYIDHLYSRDCWDRCIYNVDINIPDPDVYPCYCLNKQKHEQYKYCPSTYDCMGNCSYEQTLNDYIFINTLETELKENLAIELLKDV